MTVQKSDLLKWLALAKAAYTPEIPPGFELLGRITADPLRAHSLIDRADLDFGFVARETASGDVHCWFRGTREGVEWLDDADAVLIQGGYEDKVHKGFYGLWCALLPSIATAAFHERGEWPLSMVFGGHSLGAALATYAAAYCRTQRYLVTFEGPRAGDVAFADWLGMTTLLHLRVVNDADIVPHLPPRPLFSHAGGTVNFFRNPLDLRAAHSLELACGPAIAAMPDQIETKVNQR